jgi:hypothetical protein
LGYNPTLQKQYWAKNPTLQLQKQHWAKNPTLQRKTDMLQPNVAL